MSKKSQDKYMVDMNAVFDFTLTYLNSDVNDQILAGALNDPNSKHKQILTLVVLVVVTATSLLFGCIRSIMVLGALYFSSVVLSFLLQLNTTHCN